MVKTMLNVKTDVEVKRAAQKLAREIGVPLSTIVNAQLKALIRNRRIEFQAPLTPNARTRKILDAAEKEFRNGKVRGPFSNIDDLMRSLEE